MERSLQSESQTPMIGGYYYSIDLARAVLVLFIILSRYGVPFFSDYVTPFLNFAPGLFFLFYGYFVLRDGNDLRRHIKHTLKVFLIMFAVCLVLATVYMKVVYNAPFAYFTKRGIFNFVVLNYWGPSMGDYIWYVQSVLYSLILCHLFRRLKKYDLVLCVILFVFSFLIGEGAGLIRFNVLGYTYIPGNFLTRTLPYMLLGRVLYRHKEQLKDKETTVIYAILIAVGLILCAAEYFGFSALGILVYYGHLIGFIPLSIGIAGLMIGHHYWGAGFSVNHFGFYKKLFFVFNPLGESLMVAFYLLIIAANSELVYHLVNSLAGVVICAVCILVALGWEAIDNLVHGKKRITEIGEE